MNDENKPYIMQDIFTPTPVEFFWVLDLKDQDYTLERLDVLEEIVCNTVTLRILEFEFDVPANWNILVWSEETHELDCVEVNELGGKEFTAFVFGPSMNQPVPAVASVVNYKPEYKNVVPAIGKHQMICHPVGPSEWINLAPSDSYNKYLKNLITSDLTG